MDSDRLRGLRRIRQTLLHYETRYTQTLPEESDPSTKCPVCFTPLNPVMSSARHLMPLLQCPKCPGGQLLCDQCLYPCFYNSFISNPTCTNRSCPLISTLLKCDLVTDRSSSVCGCPLFRACPACHSLMMHVEACSNIFCQSCNYEFCFICLRGSEMCEIDDYGVCSIAPRQRFQT